jgi:hypothetical protein
VVIPTLLLLLCLLCEPDLLHWNTDSVRAIAGRLAVYGRLLLSGLFAVELLLFLLYVPGQAGGTFAGERERGTFETLALTQLSAWQLVLGKLASTLLLPTLALLGILPLTALAFMLGGVGPADLLWCAGAVLAGGILFAAIGLCCSVSVKQTWLAIGVAYAGAALVVGAVPVAYLLADAANIHLGLQLVVAGYLVLAIAVVVALGFGLLALAHRLRFLRGLGCFSVVMGALAALSFRAMLLQRSAFGHDIGELILVGLSLLLVAFAMALFFSWLQRGLAGASSRTFLLAVGGATALLAVLVSPVVLVSLRDVSWLLDHPEYFLLGNPLAALMQQGHVWAYLWSDWYDLRWAQHWFVPITVALDLLAAGLLLWVTARRVEQLRRTE